MKTVLMTHQSKQSKHQHSLFRNLAIREELIVSGGLYEGLALPAQPTPNSPPPKSLDEVPIATGIDGNPITVGDFKAYLRSIGLWY